MLGQKRRRSWKVRRQPGGAFRSSGLGSMPRGMGRNPRVLRVVTRLNVGGPARQAVYLTRELAGRGFDTRLAWGVSGRAEGELTPPDDCPSTYLPWLGRDLDLVADVRTFHALRGIVRRWRPQVIHSHLAKAGALGRSVALRAGTPVVVHTFHGHVLQEYFSCQERSVRGGRAPTGRVHRCSDRRRAVCPRRPPRAGHRPGGSVARGARRRRCGGSAERSGASR
jgi:hypothetical protein